MQPSSETPVTSDKPGLHRDNNPDATVQHAGCSLKQYAEAKKLPVAFLRSIGLQDMNYLGGSALRIPYFRTEGDEGAIRFRIALEKLNGQDNRFCWRSGSKPFLYGLWRLSQAKEAGYVVLVEGESDSHTLWYQDIPAFGLPGANNWKEERDAPCFDEIPEVYIVLEPDKGGNAVKKWLASSRIRNKVNLVNLGEFKDPSGLYIANPEQFKTQFQAALKNAIPWNTLALEEVDARRTEAWVKCEKLAREPCILDCFLECLREFGVVGESKAAKILYLILCSRFLARPVSAKICGPSSGGKSYITEKVLNFFPATAFYALSGMSERCLAYSEEPLAHRFLVLYEAAGLGGDFASYLIRSLLSEGRIRYEVAEKTKDGIRPRLIQREGPTGLLVTTTAIRLHPENETRLFSVPVTDTSGQTKNILLALAQSDDSATDLSYWHALQTWLEGAEHRVVVPYAKALAEATPPVAVRLRRDFGAILSLIKTHTILHQATRNYDSKGQLIATIEDYSIVRELVQDLVAEGLEASVSTTIRETVKVVSGIVRSGEKREVTVAEVARGLRLDKSSAYRRVRVATDRGYLKNLEDKKGRAARLVLGEPMPDDLEILPHPDKLLPPLSGCKGCTVASETEGVHIPPSPPPDETSGGRANNHAGYGVTDVSDINSRGVCEKKNNQKGCDYYQVTKECRAAHEIELMTLPVKSGLEGIGCRSFQASGRCPGADAIEELMAEDAFSLSLNEEQQDLWP